MRKERGFTLIELLIVLAILGILVGIVAMSIGGLTDTAKQRGMTSELNVVQTAIDTWNTQDLLLDPVNNAIEARSESDVITVNAPVDDEFWKYMRRSTRYYFAWGDGGQPLIVCDAAGATLAPDNATNPTYWVVTPPQNSICYWHQGLVQTGTDFVRLAGQ